MYILYIIVLKIKLITNLHALSVAIHVPPNRWAAFRKVANIMKSRKASMNVKSKVHNEYVLPVMVYGTEEGSHGTTVSRTAQNGAHHARHHPTRPQT